MTTHLFPLLEKLPNHAVCVVGDVMLDHFIYGAVERISPEAPIPVLHIQRETETLGGAGNVAQNLLTLGGAVTLIGVVGQDSAGEKLQKNLAAHQGMTPRLIVDSTRPTTLKTRYIADGQQMLRADHEIARPVAATLEEQILTELRATLPPHGVVILSDYAKGVLTPRVIAGIIAHVKESGGTILIDPKGRDFSRYHGASLLTPNRKELTEVSGTPIRTVEDAEKAARALIDQHALDGVLAKLGSDGVCLVMRGKPAQHFRTTAREAFDVSGAGDTVVATLALALAGGVSVENAAELANLAGSIVVGKIGTASISCDELGKELMREQAAHSEDKIIPLPHAADRAERWRKKGLKVGFTNGCFDLLHPGHIALLRQARAACDKLIVGLNSDASVKRLKGETRPVQNETSRATVLASLADVDALVIFSEDTPLELIKTIRPDVLVKGADYTVEQVVGGDLVQSWGGQIILAHLAQGHSTTGTISRLQNKAS